MEAKAQRKDGTVEAGKIETDLAENIIYSAQIRQVHSGQIVSLFRSD